MEKKWLVVFVWIARLLLGGFFLLAGILKAFDPANFQHEILAYQIVGYPISFIVAYYLPFFEIALGVGVIIGCLTRFALRVIILMLFVFIGLLFWTWKNGINLDCGCLGNIDFISGQPAAILRDIVLLFLAFFIYLYDRKARATGRSRGC